MNERGSLTAFTAVFMLALLALAGLVIDGGRYLAAKEEAMAEAAQAARAGADAVDAQSLRAGVVSIDPAAAVTAAESSIAATGHSGFATVTGTTVFARVDPFPISTTILGIVGIGHISVSADAEATIVHGVSFGD